MVDIYSGYGTAILMQNVTVEKHFCKVLRYLNGLQADVGTSWQNKCPTNKHIPKHQQWGEKTLEWRTQLHKDYLEELTGWWLHLNVFGNWTLQGKENKAVEYMLGTISFEGVEDQHVSYLGYQCKIPASVCSTAFYFPTGVHSTRHFPAVVCGLDCSGFDIKDP